ncbi:hypothetical protein FMEAI12_5360005 [Parafrankia sp. Ea1.12]|nr:hypothetical protein FMEAI12_5360005 [Parafrankia sp. Ea1.12]
MADPFRLTSGFLGRGDVGREGRGLRAPAEGRRGRCGKFGLQRRAAIYGCHRPCDKRGCSYGPMLCSGISNLRPAIVNGI